VTEARGQLVGAEEDGGAAAETANGLWNGARARCRWSEWGKAADNALGGGLSRGSAAAMTRSGEAACGQRVYRGDGARWRHFGLTTTLDSLRDSSCALLDTGKKMAWVLPATRRLSSTAPGDGSTEMGQRGGRRGGPKLGDGGLEVADVASHGVAAGLPLRTSGG
jgi:hypothetical protein